MFTARNNENFIKLRTLQFNEQGMIIKTSTYDEINGWTKTKLLNCLVDFCRNFVNAPVQGANQFECLNNMIASHSALKTQRAAVFCALASSFDFKVQMVTDATSIYVEVQIDDKWIKLNLDGHQVCNHTDLIEDDYSVSAYNSGMN